MTLSLFLIIAAIITLSSSVGAWYQWAAFSDKYKQYRIRTPDRERITLDDRKKVTPIGSTVSIAFIFGMLYFFGNYYIDFSIVDGEVVYGKASLLTIFGETIGILLFYDFMYYWGHRAMHIPAIMKPVHAIHHRARFPTAIDSLFVSVTENLVGLGLLFVALTVFSPINVASFLLIFFVYTLSNIVVHTNMVIPHPAFKLFNFWAKQHDVHHGVNLQNNYCNIFPYWDILFGTYIYTSSNEKKEG